MTETREYKAVVAELITDPIIHGIAAEVTGTLLVSRAHRAALRATLLNPDGTPKAEFIDAVNQMYALRGGTFIGHGHRNACAHAVMLVITNSFPQP